MPRLRWPPSLPFPVHSSLSVATRAFDLFYKNNFYENAIPDVITSFHFSNVVHHDIFEISTPGFSDPFSAKLGVNQFGRTEGDDLIEYFFLLQRDFFFAGLGINHFGRSEGSDLIKYLVSFSFFFSLSLFL